ncbi:MAG: DUF2442 domain-containing protein [Tannerella sp.]|jgi:hypothetical protein|nr:DUF2442 domain-containing protein [Tannerella sp.]
MGITVKKVWIDENAVYIQTDTGNIFSEQFADYPRLRRATSEQRAKFEYDNIGIHWEDIDEDLGYEGFVYNFKDCVAVRDDVPPPVVAEPFVRK